MTKGALARAQSIETRIIMLRDTKVLLDYDLADLYGVETKYLTRQVRRHQDRFPEDFCFLLSRKEFNDLKCQIGTARQWGGRRRPPLAFTEQGVAMLSGVLNSPRAVQVNIAIMRAFVRLRGILESHRDLAHKLKELEKDYDSKFQVVFKAIRALMQ